MTLNEVYQKCNSIDVLIGWQGPDLYEAGCAIAYISGANDLCVRGAIHADVVGVADGDDVTLFGYLILIRNNSAIDSDDWRLWIPGPSGTYSRSLPLTMYRGNERIGDAVLFEVER